MDWSALVDLASRGAFVGALACLVFQLNMDLFLATVLGALISLGQAVAHLVGGIETYVLLVTAGLVAFNFRHRGMLFLHRIMDAIFPRHAPVTTRGR